MASGTPLPRRRTRRAHRALAAQLLEQQALEDDRSHHSSRSPGPSRRSRRSHGRQVSDQQPDSRAERRSARRRRREEQQQREAEHLVLQRAESSTSASDLSSLVMAAATLHRGLIAERSLRHDSAVQRHGDGLVEGLEVRESGGRRHATTQGASSSGAASGSGSEACEGNRKPVGQFSKARDHPDQEANGGAADFRIGARLSGETPRGQCVEGEGQDKTHVAGWCSAQADGVAKAAADDDGDSCAICFDRLNHVAVHGCGHQLCMECAMQLCMVGTGIPLCPFCRASINGFCRAKAPQLMGT